MRLLVAIPVMFLILLCPFYIVHAQSMDAVEILKKTDSVINAAKDAHVRIKTILIDKDGNQKVRESETFEKGKSKRLIKFISPPDQKGISFLSLPGDVQYVYLPAFHKVRRIASSAKFTNFAGTDFSYDDLSTFEYSPIYTPKLIETTADAYVLELTPKPGVKKDYSKLKMWIRKDNFYPYKTESYDKKGSLWKVLERRRIEKVNGYWVAKEVEMTDTKAKHSTKMIIEDIKLDVGLSDDLFTERNMSK